MYICLKTLALFCNEVTDIANQLSHLECLVTCHMIWNSSLFIFSLQVCGDEVARKTSLNLSKFNLFFHILWVLQFFKWSHEVICKRKCVLLLIGLKMGQIDILSLKIILLVSLTIKVGLSGALGIHLGIKRCDFKSDCLF